VGGAKCPAGKSLSEAVSACGALIGQGICWRTRELNMNERKSRTAMKNETYPYFETHVWSRGWQGLILAVSSLSFSFLPSITRPVSRLESNTYRVESGYLPRYLLGAVLPPGRWLIASSFLATFVIHRAKFISSSLSRSSALSTTHRRSKNVHNCRLVFLLPHDASRFSLSVISLEPRSICVRVSHTCLFVSVLASLSPPL